MHTERMDTNSNVVLDEATKLKYAKAATEASVFMDFIIRHVAVVTYKFNIFFLNKLPEFSSSMNELCKYYEKNIFKKKLRKKKKKKKRKKKGNKEVKEVETKNEAGIKEEDGGKEDGGKKDGGKEDGGKKDGGKEDGEKKDGGTEEDGEKKTKKSVFFAEETDEEVETEPIISMPSFKSLNQTMVACRNSEETFSSASELLDLFGRMNGLLSMAGNIFKNLMNVYQNDDTKKEKLEDVNYYYKHWIGFGNRTHDVRSYKYPINLLPERLSPSEIKHIVWPLIIRTAIYCATQFIKDVAELTDFDVASFSALKFNKFLTSEELITLKNIFETFEKKNIFNLLMGAPSKKLSTYENNYPEIDPSQVKYTIPIVMDTILLNFPYDI